MTPEDVIDAARAAEAKLAAIARTRRPTSAETAEADRAYRAADRARGWRRVFAKLAAHRAIRGQS